MRSVPPNEIHGPEQPQKQPQSRAAKVEAPWERAAHVGVFLLIDCSIKLQHIRDTSIAKG